MASGFNVTINRKVRPLRLAFLIEPANRQQLLRALQINTILWGGRHNPLIPVYRRTPTFWSEKPLPVPPAKEIVNGYLRAFDPDFLVNMTELKIQVQGYEAEGFEKRILSPNEVLNPNDPDTPVNYGIDVAELYAHLYAEEFRFQRRDPVRVLLPEAQHNDLKLLGAACYGCFPPEKELQYSREEYLHALGGELFPVEVKDLYAPLRSTNSYPLRIGSQFLQYGLGTDANDAQDHPVKSAPNFRK